MRIRKMIESDLLAVVDLCEKKRNFYQEHQPLFWKKSENSREKHLEFLSELLIGSKVIMLTAENKEQVVGAIIGSLIEPPAVYSAGLACYIDDFVVHNEDWKGVGKALIEAIKAEAKQKNATQILVVSGEHDLKKNNFLKECNLSIVSHWWVKDL